jgi:hypothetical protein
VSMSAERISEIIEELKTYIAGGEVSRREVARRLGLGDLAAESPRAEQVSSLARRMTLTRVFYYLGGLIVLIGIGFLIYQIWEDIGSVGHVLVTLGFAIVLYIVGTIFMKSYAESEVGVVMHILGALLMPTGVYVLLFELNRDPIALEWIVSWIFLGVTLMYAISYFLNRHPVFTFFSVVYGTGMLYAFSTAILNFPGEDFFAYLTMAIGVGYMLLARGFKNTRNSVLSGFFSAFGSLGFLGAAFSRVFDSLFWQLLFLALVSGGIILSLRMKSKAVLIFSTLFLIAHIVFLTSEYFADSVGWPVALIILGFVIIGVGYASFRLGKKYL